MKMFNKICKWYDICPMKRFYEKGKLDEKWIKDYCFKDGRDCRRFDMVEKDIYCADNILPNGEIDENLK